MLTEIKQFADFNIRLVIFCRIQNMLSGRKRLAAFSKSASHCLLEFQISKMLQSLLQAFPSSFAATCGVARKSAIRTTMITKAVKKILGGHHDS